MAIERSLHAIFARRHGVVLTTFTQRFDIILARCAQRALVQILTRRRKLHEQPDRQSSRGLLHSVRLDDHFAASAGASDCSPKRRSMTVRMVAPKWWWCSRAGSLWRPRRGKKRARIYPMNFCASGGLSGYAVVQEVPLTFQSSTDINSICTINCCCSRIAG